MIYFTVSNKTTFSAIADGRLGCIDSPINHGSVPDTAIWAADNGSFSAGYPGDIPFLNWLARRSGKAATCKFAVAPDVVADARATMERSIPFFPIIRAMGFPAALAAQNGLEFIKVPWDDFDVLFIGGDTNWKLGVHAAHIVTRARELDKWVHMGRVNSHKRLKYAMSIGCQSVDGTHAAIAPDKNLPDVLKWVSPDEDRTKRCEWCSILFIPVRSDARTHSDACRKALSRARLDTV